MSKSQFYLQQCSDVASKSTMCFHLGALLVKGGKVISSGYNHHRTHYDGSDSSHGQRKPVSMHAEMHAIYNATGMSPAFSKQVQGDSRRVSDSSRNGSDAGWVDEDEDEEQQQQQFQTQPTSSSDISDSEITDLSPSLRDIQSKARSCLKGQKGGAGKNPPTKSKQKHFCNSERELKSHGRSGRRDSGSGSDHYSQPHVQSPLEPFEDVKLYDVRRRDPRVNGADLYVARFTKNGLGPAKPCGRCLEWCRWAGVKRVFHWNPDSGSWDALKVNDPSNAYLTHADHKINTRTFKAYTYARSK
ncbi:hypothetical protein FRB99_003058 [Tulasnella sp. 403]|nr:hypothetical protein FRB99_003058 [Tulasnella sp. 403]